MDERYFKIVTLGCRTNQYESQAFKSQLEALGWQQAKEADPVGLCIVNTCTVTAQADKDSLLEVRRLIRRHPAAKVVVTGCAAEAHQKLKEEIPEIYMVVANPQKEELIAQLFPQEEVPEFAINQFDAHTRAFVKVQDGCNSFCTYCIIPYVRGRSRSRSVASVVQEVKQLVANGYQEIVLTGINIGDFDGGDPANPVRLSELVHAVDQIEGVKRLRLSSIDPDEVDEELSAAILEGKNTAPCLHLVLQSGSNAILKRMNRKYTRQIFLDSVEKLRQKAPHFTFTTDIIVGFPGEEEADFQETVEVVREVGFAKVHLFPYSERPRTRAALYPNKVPLEIMKMRKAQLLQESARVAFELQARFVGEEVMVLTEFREDRRVFGHSEHFLGVWIEESQLAPNQLVRVKLVENSVEGLIARIA